MIDVIGFVRTLQEHAIKRKIALRKIDALQFQIKRHLIKIALYPYHQSTDHWIKEILTWFLDISEIEIKGQGVLKEKEYFRLLYEEPWIPLRVVEQGIKNVIGMNKDLNPCIENLKEKAIKIDSKAKELFKQLSKDLNKGSFDVEKYRNLLEKYKTSFLEDCND